MTIVRNVEGVWQAFEGAPVALVRMESTIQIHFADGRVITDVPTDPYPVEMTLDPAKVAYLVAEGTWGAQELAEYGLRIAEPFVVPDGKMIAGERRFFEDQNGAVAELYDLEDLPPPPPPPTKEERIAAFLAAYQLSVEDLRELVGTQPNAD